MCRRTPSSGQTTRQDHEALPRCSLPLAAAAVHASPEEPKQLSQDQQQSPACCSQLITQGSQRNLRQARPQVLDRTQRVQYEIPANARISSACRHFLAQLLVGDPAKRLSTAGIMEHPWFRHGLPEGVYSLNDECLRLKVRSGASGHASAALQSAGASSARHTAQ